MTHYLVTIAGTSVSYPCSDQETLLQGMERLGKKGIPCGCRQGGCGVCRVRILCGDTASKAMSRAHMSAEEEARGELLACRTYPRSDLTLRVDERMQARIERETP